MVDPLFARAGIMVARTDPVPMWVLHCAPADALGVALLAGPMLRAVDGDAGAALRLAPDEWLLVGGVGFVGDFDHALVDVSVRSLGVAVSGPLAAAVLNAGCPLDLDIGVFPDGACTRTLLGKADIVLWRRGGDFQLYHGRSFDPYVTALLVEAAAHAVI